MASSRALRPTLSLRCSWHRRSISAPRLVVTHTHWQVRQKGALELSDDDTCQDTDRGSQLVAFVSRLGSSARTPKDRMFAAYPNTGSVILMEPRHAKSRQAMVAMLHERELGTTRARGNLKERESNVLDAFSALYVGFDLPSKTAISYGSIERHL